MKRREFITLVGGAVAWPFAAQAQRTPMSVIGFLNPTSPDGYAQQLTAFRKGLSEAGYIEGQNVRIEYRWANGQYDRLAELANDLVKSNVKVIYASGGDVSALAAKKATTTIPIVFSTGNDPVKIGLVASLAKPGGNLTGVGRLAVQLLPKRLQLVREAVPKASMVALLHNPNNSNADSLVKELVLPAEALGLKLTVLPANSETTINAAFVKLAQMQPDALIIGPDAFFNTRAEQLGSLSARHMVPAIYQLREFVVAGGLMGLGPNLHDAFRRAGIYVGKILDGALPADLPVEQQARIEFIINLRTAKALGIELPLSLIASADEVIE